VNVALKTRLQPGASLQSPETVARSKCALLSFCTAAQEDVTQSVATMAAALHTCRHSPGCGRLPLGVVIAEPRLHVRGLTASVYGRQELHQGLNIADFAAELLLSTSTMAQKLHACWLWHGFCRLHRILTSSPDVAHDPAAGHSAGADKDVSAPFCMLPLVPLALAQPDLRLFAVEAEHCHSLGHGAGSAVTQLPSSHRSLNRAWCWVTTVSSVASCVRASSGLLGTAVEHVRMI
jgi:hypothetical protein